VSPRALPLAGIAADADTMTETPVYHGTPEWVALIEWLEWHGIDAKAIPAGTRVSRDACGRCIRYVGIVVDEDGKPVWAERDADGIPTRFKTAPMVEQGEAPPLPYPALIARQLR
jgi:hypothetical protein